MAEMTNVIDIDEGGLVADVFHSIIYYYCISIVAYHYQDWRTSVKTRYSVLFSIQYQRTKPLFILLFWYDRDQCQWRIDYQLLAMAWRMLAAIQWYW